MKKLIILMVLISVSVWGNYPFSQKSLEEVVELAEKVDLMIEGEVIAVKQYYVHKDERRILELEEINERNIGKVRTYTNYQLRLKKILKM